jgi:fumarate hydratase class I
MTFIPAGPDRARYRRVEARGLRRTVCAGRPALRVPDGALAALAREAFTDLAFFLRPDFLAAMRRIIDDPGASPNDRFVAEAVLRNAIIAAEGVLPLCQDTGSIQMFAFRGDRVVTDGRDEDVLAAAASGVYKTRNLRYSIMAPLSVMDEVNTGTNLPAQIELQAAAGREYRFFFLAKGGGSSNKIALFQESKARLEDRALETFLA